MAEAVVTALRAQAGGGGAPAGDILAFLPGVAEIRNTQRLLDKQLPTSCSGEVQVQVLHGSLAPRDQDRVVGWRPQPGSPRCVHCLRASVLKRGLGWGGVGWQLRPDGSRCNCLYT
jgi:HrpA-like RNA helicase